MRVTTTWLTLFLLIVLGSSCGYLDSDLFTDDETFEETLGYGGLGLGGVGTSSGCGGFGHFGRRGYPRITGRAAMELELGAMSISVMSDAEILEKTEVDIIVEQAATEPEPAAAASLPAQAYYEQLDARNRTIAERY